MKNTVLLIILALVVELAQCKKQTEQQSLLHWGIKVGFWLLLGVSLGVYFQARLKLKELTKGIVEVVLYGLFIAVAVYTMFTVGELVRQYL